MITGRVSGDSAVLLYFKSRTIVLRDTVGRVVSRWGFTILAAAKEKVSGPVLKNRTGTLRRKINFTKTETPDAVVGSVGLSLSYAAAHEYGFDGLVTVREHLRTSKLGTSFTVRSFERHQHTPERSFLRTSLAESAPSFREDLRAAVRLSF